MTKQEEFLVVFDTYIKRAGAKELRDYLLRSDFFTAPASSKYHCAYEGGLCEHSLNVYLRLKKNMISEYGDEWEKFISHESVAICGLLHDVCKIDFYKEEMRNVKENGEWVKKPYYSKDELLPYGHGEKSVYIVNGFIKLTREEAMAINWHMGGFDSRARGGDQSVSLAYCQFPFAMHLHIADMQATFVDEKRG